MAHPKRRILILAAFGNNPVEIVNTFDCKVVHTITGLNEPQGVLLIPELDKICVANAESGTVNVFDGKTYEPRKSIPLGEESDPSSGGWEANGPYVTWLPPLIALLPGCSLRRLSA
jgi:DNA-binding beta-propeller fold protein YncE